MPSVLAIASSHILESEQFLQAQKCRQNDMQVPSNATIQDVSTQQNSTLFMVVAPLQLAWSIVVLLKTTDRNQKWTVGPAQCSLVSTTDNPLNGNFPF